MFFLNLSLAEFLALASASSALLVALYLLDRSRRKQVVATLRFWNVAERISQMKHRRRIQQPWSLILQLISILLLLAALAQLRWGAPERAGRDHVILLDTSAWTAARGQSGTLLDDAKAAVIAYLRALPSSDRAMLVRADAIAAPATRFETRPAVLIDAVRQSRPGAAALNLEGALQFARQAQKLEGRTPGEVVYAGPARVLKQDATPAPSNSTLRILPVREPGDNCGLRKISLRRSHTDPGLWDIFVAVRNYGRARRSVPLALAFGNAPIGAHRFSLAPGEEQGVTFQYRTRSGGWLEARLLMEDSLAGDNRAVLEVPAQPVVRVQVYSNEPNLLRPVLGANPNVDAVYSRPSEYSAKTEARIVILDRFRPAAPPETDAIWIDPPAGASPFPVKSTVSNVPLERWHGENPLGAGLRTRDLKLDNAQVFIPREGDLEIADCAVGPVILARPGRHKTVAFGFHPGRTAMRFELATPLVFANVLRWLAPEVFRRWELNGGSVGIVSAGLDAGADPAAVRVLAEGERTLPFTVQGHTLRFFTASPGVVRVVAGDRETVYSLTLPEVAEARWEAPSSALRGVPKPGETGPASRDVWQALALAGAAGLLAEWMLFGRGRSWEAGGGQVLAWVDRPRRYLAGRLKRRAG